MNAADPVTMEVVSNALGSIADEMALVVMRTAYSTIVRDSMDYSTGLCDRRGQVVAHGITMALHLGSFPDAMQALVRSHGNDMRPGDMFIFNDPYVAAGTKILRRRPSFPGHLRRTVRFSPYSGVNCPFDGSRRPWR